jgi:hypothetical protein
MALGIDSHWAPYPAECLAHMNGKGEGICHKFSETDLRIIKG